MRIGYFIAWQVQMGKVPQWIVYSYQFASCIFNCVMIFEPKCFCMGGIDNAVDSINGPDAQLPFVHDRFCFIEARQYTWGRFRQKPSTGETPLSKTIQSIKVNIIVDLIVMSIQQLKHNYKIWCNFHHLTYIVSIRED